MNNDSVMISYKLTEKERISVEVTTSVKKLLEQSDRQIRSHRRQDRRYHDTSVRTDGESTSPRMPTYDNTAELLEKMDHDARLRAALAVLTAKQRRRWCMFCFDEMNYNQIASIEGVNSNAVADSIKRAKKRLEAFYQK